MSFSSPHPTPSNLALQKCMAEDANVRRNSRGGHVTMHSLTSASHSAHTQACQVQLANDATEWKTRVFLHWPTDALTTSSVHFVRSTQAKHVNGTGQRTRVGGEKHTSIYAALWHSCSRIYTCHQQQVIEGVVSLQHKTRARPGSYVEDF